MNKNKNQLLRLQNMIENDRLTTGDNFIQLVVCDADKLLRDYFDFHFPPELTIEKHRDGYLVNLSITANRIKKFANIEK